MKLFVISLKIIYFFNTFSESQIFLSVFVLSVPGEIIGIDYLLHQTGKALQHVHPDLEETDQMLEDVGTEEVLEDEGFEDTGFDPTVEVFNLSSDPTPVTTSSAQVPPTSLKASAGPAAPAATAGPFLSPPTTVIAPQQQLVSVFFM